MIFKMTLGFSKASHTLVGMEGIIPVMEDSLSQ